MSLYQFSQQITHNTKLRLDGVIPFEIYDTLPLNEHNPNMSQSLNESLLNQMDKISYSKLKGQMQAISTDKQNFGKQVNPNQQSNSSLVNSSIAATGLSNSKSGKRRQNVQKRIVSPGKQESEVALKADRTEDNPWRSTGSYPNENDVLEFDFRDNNASLTKPDFDLSKRSLNPRKGDKPKKKKKKKKNGNAPDSPKYPKGLSHGDTSKGKTYDLESALQNDDPFGTKRNSAYSYGMDPLTSQPRHSQTDDVISSSQHTTASSSSKISSGGYNLDSALQNDNPFVSNKSSQSALSGSSGGGYNLNAALASDNPFGTTALPPGNLNVQVPCDICGRSFFENRMQKHRQACQKTAEKNASKKVYNSAALRAAGWQNTSSVKKFASANEIKKQKAKAKADDLRYGTATPKKKSTKEPQMIECPNCSRSFNEKSFPIHSRICANVFGKRGTPAPQKSKTSRTQTLRNNAHTKKIAHSPQKTKHSRHASTISSSSLQSKNMDLDSPGPTPKKNNRIKQGMVKCPDCKRVFQAKSIEIHMRICKRAAKRKR